MVRALASHQCGLGSIPGPGVICGLILLLVLYYAPRGFSPGIPVFPSHQKPTFPNSNSILESWNRTSSCELLGVPWINKLHIYILHIFTSTVSYSPYWAGPSCLSARTKFGLIVQLSIATSYMLIRSYYTS